MSPFQIEYVYAGSKNDPALLPIKVYNKYSVKSRGFHRKQDAGTCWQWHIFERLLTLVVGWCYIYDIF